MYKYEELEVWQLALKLIEQYYALLRRFPDDERFALAAQGRRAVVSIALNIAEGSGRSTDRDFSLFVNRSITSLIECDAVLKIALRLAYIRQVDYDKLLPAIKEEYFKLIAFNRTLHRNPDRRRRYTDDSE